MRGWKHNDPSSPLKPALKSPDLPKNKKLLTIVNDHKSAASFRGLNIVEAMASAMGSTEKTADSGEETPADFSKVPAEVLRKLQKKASLENPAILRISETVSAKKAMKTIKLKKAESQYVSP